MLKNMEKGIYHLLNFVKKKTKGEKKEFNTLPGFDTHICILNSKTSQLFTKLYGCWIYCKVYHSFPKVYHSFPKVSIVFQKFPQFSKSFYCFPLQCKHGWIGLKMKPVLLSSNSCLRISPPPLPKLNSVQQSGIARQACSYHCHFVFE